jgi:hypothetical protein
LKNSVYHFLIIIIITDIVATGLYVQLNHFQVLRNQLIHIFANETLYERARKKANRPLFPPPLDNKPFDLGLETNVKQWFVD